MPCRLAVFAVYLFLLACALQLLRTIRFFLYKRKDAVAQWPRNLQSTEMNHEKEVRACSCSVNVHIEAALEKTRNILFSSGDFIHFPRGEGLFADISSPPPPTPRKGAFFFPAFIVCVFFLPCFATSGVVWCIASHSMLAASSL